MEFPGEDYELYSQNPRIRVDSARYIAAGVKNFLFIVESSGLEWKTGLQFLQENWKTDWELVRIEAKRAWIYTPDGRKAAGVWRIYDPERGSIRELHEKYGRVFIDPGTVARHRELDQSGLREILTTQRAVRGTRFVAFGSLAYQFWYQFGLAGGAIQFRSPNTKKVMDFRTPDLKRHYVTTTVPQEWKDRLPPGADRPMMAIVFAKLIPVWVKEFYEKGVEPIDVQDKYLKETIHALKRMQEKEFFVTHQGNAGVGILWPVDGDKRLCDTCSLQYSCRLYKRGSVCILPDKETARLAEFFGTRESKDVIDGIGKLLTFRANRFESMVETERTINERRALQNEPALFDPEIDKMAGAISKDAERFAKLIDPALTRPQVAVQVNNNPAIGAATERVASVREYTNRELSGAARELEAAGTSRDAITPEMLVKHLHEKENGQVIEGVVVDGIKNDF